MTTGSALQEINDAILDLQRAEYDTFGRPLKRLALILESSDLKPITDKLKGSVDFETFLAGADDRAATAGSGSLNWPTNREEELGLALILIERGANNPRWFSDFAYTYYNKGSKFIDSIRKITSSVIIPFGRDFKRYVEQHSRRRFSTTVTSDSDRVFIVHGHDEGPREMVARFITNIGLEPVILHEQENRGMTVPEKLDTFGNVGYAVVLLTPDDMGRTKSESKESPRARQNVILELGYFVARLGRERVAALKKGDVEIPSDYLGVVYTQFDEGGAWRLKLAQELRSSGYEIDLNKIVG